MDEVKKDYPVKDRDFAAFDIEIYKAFSPEMGDWKLHRPVGISVAGIYAGGGVELIYNEDGGQLSRNRAYMLVDRLDYISRTHTLLTWNGTGFDWDILAEESGEYRKCKRLALEAVDPMFQFWTRHGYPVGLDAVGQGMGVGRKMENMNGALAPLQWERGGEGRAKVLDYVTQDVKLTYACAREIEKKQYLAWVTKTGKEKVSHLMGDLELVKDMLDRQEPNNSWMDRPIRRSDFVGWMEEIG